MREISVNTALRCRLLSHRVSPLQSVDGIDTEEVDGSNPFGPTIFSTTYRYRVSGLVSFGVKALDLFPTLDAVIADFLIACLPCGHGSGLFLNSALIELTVACALLGISYM